MVEIRYSETIALAFTVNLPIILKPLVKLYLSLDSSFLISLIYFIISVKTKLYKSKD